jgi:hypothetical protein
MEEAFSTLQRQALGIFALPSNVLRAFSSAKTLITSEMNSLGDNIIEALECFDQKALDLGQNAYYLVHSTVKSTHPSFPPLEVEMSRADSSDPH